MSSSCSMIMNTLRGKWEEETGIKIRNSSHKKKDRKEGRKRLALQQTGAPKIMTQLKNLCTSLSGKLADSVCVEKVIPMKHPSSDLCK